MSKFLKRVVQVLLDPFSGLIIYQTDKLQEKKADAEKGSSIPAPIAAEPVTPVAPPVAPATTQSVIDTSVQAAAESEAERLKKRRGFKSTIKTSPSGILEPAQTLKTKLG